MKRKPVGLTPEASEQSSPEWVERLKGQVQAENTIEGHPGQPARIAEVHRMMMEQAANIMGHTHQTGGYAQSDALHQLGIMGNEPVLGPASQVASDRAN